MKYIKKFETLSAQTEYLNSADIDTYLGYVDENDTVYYDDALPVPEEQYLTIETLSAGNLSIANAGSNVFNYSLDGGSTWNTLATGQTVAIEANKKVLFKAEGLSTSRSGIGNIKYTGNFNVHGNVMSLVYGDNFIGQEVMNNGQFMSLFANNGALLSAENLILPAQTLTQCCYQAMFWQCESLTTAPELPATILAEDCYWSMFNGCTSLTTAPELPAITLAVHCYANMFQSCGSLNYIKCLATDISANACTSLWVLSVGSTGTFVKNAAMAGWTTGFEGIPDGWTVQDA